MKESSDKIRASCFPLNVESQLKVLAVDAMPSLITSQPVCGGWRWRDDTEAEGREGRVTQ
jgi:hypothetical protein